MDMSSDDFSSITRRIHADTGIVIGAAKRSMLVARLSHRLTSLGLPDFAAYARLLDSPAGMDERRALVSAITTNVTRFFREPHHFDVLSAKAPALLEKARAGGRIRLWSAGCSTGEEAYSIAAALLEHAPGIGRHDVRILATDIDPRVVDTARSGRYRADQTGTDIPAYFRRHFNVGDRDGTLVPAPDVAGMIRFEVLNLMDPWPFAGMFDVVFCRNVVIYFDAETRKRLWMRLAAQIVTGGTLFVGHSERLDPELQPLFEPSGITQYTRTGLRSPAGPARPETQLQPSGNTACLSETP